MLALCLAASTSFAPLSSAPAAPVVSRSAASPVMQIRKVLSFEDDDAYGVFEPREVSVKRKP